MNCEPKKNDHLIHLYKNQSWNWKFDTTLFYWIAHDFVTKWIIRISMLGILKDIDFKLKRQFFNYLKS